MAKTAKKTRVWTPRKCVICNKEYQAPPRVRYCGDKCKAEYQEKVKSGEISTTTKKTPASSAGKTGNLESIIRLIVREEIRHFFSKV